MFRFATEASLFQPHISARRPERRLLNRASDPFAGRLGTAGRDRTTVRAGLDLGLYDTARERVTRWAVQLKTTRT